MNRSQNIADMEDTKQLKICLIEDSDSDAFLFENLLMGIGDIEVDIQRADRLEDAKRVVTEQEFDVILLDLSLPDSSGLSTLCSLLDATTAPVVVLTGSPDLKLRNTAIRKGAQDYLPKNGLDAEILRRTIEYSIERQGLIHSLNQKLNELKVSELRTRRMFDQSFDGIAVVDKAGKFLYLNPAAEEIFGSSTEMLFGNPLGPDMTETIIEIPKVGGSSKAKVELRKRIIDWKNEKAWLIVLRDISGKIDLEEKLRHSQKLEAVGHLAGGVAHDFNNQLTAIMGFTELAIRSKDPVGTKRFLEHVRKSTEKAAALTSQLLTFGRKQVLKPESICLNALLEDIEKMLGRVIRESIEIKIVPHDVLHYVLVDPTQIDQVIMNLVINASDAMPSGGKIVIETANVTINSDDLISNELGELASGDYVQLTVSDSGIGMDEKTLSRVFEPFFTTKEVGKGTGLGLATVYGIVKQSKGHVTVYSELGIGTTFKIYLPRTGATPRKTGPIPSFDASIPMPTTILLVEDESEVLEMVKTVLEMERCTVFCANNGEAALKLIHELKVPVDLLLTDLIMPKMGGKELADRIIEKFPDIKIIFMSGYTRETVVQNGILEEGINLLQKPIAPYSLIRSIKTIFAAETSKN